MPLQGTFDVLDLTAVLELLAAREMTGRLHVRSRSFGANLFVEQGKLVGADQSEHQAAAVAGDVRSRLQEICFELLDNDRGTFEFQPGRPGGLPGTTPIEVAEILDEARQRMAEWHELQQIIPSLDVQPHLVSELDPDEVTLDRERWRVLTAVDGRRNLRAIGRTLNMSDFEVCRVIRELLEAGAVQLDNRPVGMAGVTEVESPVVTEQITINGKRATRLRPRPLLGEATEAAGEPDEPIDLNPELNLTESGEARTASIDAASIDAADTAGAPPVAEAGEPASVAASFGSDAEEADGGPLKRRRSVIRLRPRSDTDISK
jgi:hypothetical protein